MNEWTRAMVLGMVQGVTEFVPVSSSGHLVIVPWLLGWEAPGLLFDTVLHWGTLLAILLVFWRDFWQMTVAALVSLHRRSLADPQARLAWYIVVGTVPVVVVGLALQDGLKQLFDSHLAAGAFLLVTALLLVGSELLVRHRQRLHGLAQMSWADSLWIGFAQAAALAPGISRSGSTIAAGLARGLRREAAARYSFLLGTPAFLGAGLLQLVDAWTVDAGQLVEQAPVLAVGFLVSAVTGIGAIRFMLAYLRTRSLYGFALYCTLVGLAVIAWSLARG